MSEIIRSPSAHQTMWKSLADKAYRHAYSVAHTGDFLAMQILSLRQKRGWTQNQLAEKSGSTQPQISNFETSCESLKLSTLQKVAEAFDVALLVKFVPFSELARESLTATADRFIPSFDEDSPEKLRPAIKVAVAAPTRTSLSRLDATNRRSQVRSAMTISRPIERAPWVVSQGENYATR